MFVQLEVVLVLVVGLGLVFLLGLFGFKVFAELGVFDLALFDFVL